MSNIISGQELLHSIKNRIFMENGKEDNCEGIKYDFRLGDRILKAAFKRPINFSDLSNIERGNCEIAPGEVVFVMTEEKLTLPADVFCQLSNKRKIGHGGIILLGGLTIDPSYNGRLIFGLYNISCRPYPIKPGKKLVAGVFYKIANDNHDIPIPESMEDFPDDLVDMISKYEPFSPSNVSGDIQAIRCELDIIKGKLDKDEEWKKDFKDGLTDVTEKLDEIADKLSKEVTARQTSDTKLDRKLDVLKGIGLVLGGLIGGGLVSILVMWIAGVFNLG